MRLPIILLFTLILYSSFALSFNNAYTNVGYDRQSDYVSPNNLLLSSGPITIQGTLTLNGSIPLSTDLLGNGNNNLILLTNNNYLYIQNYTGTTFSNLASAYIGSTQLDHRDQRQTPGIIDYDNDGNQEIIVFNQTHFIIYNYTLASGLTVENTSTYLTNTTDTGTCGGAVTPQHEIIKCTKTGLPNNIAACFVLSVYHTASVSYDELYMYDLTNNTVQNSQVTNAYCNFDHAYGRNLFLIDMNNNGYYEAAYGIYDSANGDVNISMTSVNSDDTLTTAPVYLNNMPSGYWNSDITVGNFDGITSNGLEIGIVYRSAAESYASKTISHTGTLLKTQTIAGSIKYTSSTPSPSLISDTNGYYCAGIINLSVADTDDLFIACFDSSTQSVGQYVSSGISPITAFTLSKAQVNSTYNYVTSTAAYLNNGSAASFAQGYLNAAVFDYKNTGSASVLLSNVTSYAMYDTLYTNSPPAITDKGFGTGNPACLGVVQKYTMSVTDAEKDQVTCYTGTTYVNGTLKYNTTAQSASSPASFSFLETLNETGSFYVNYYCKDSYHAYAGSSLVLTVSNDTLHCNAQDQNGFSVSTNSTETNATADWDSQLNTLYGNVGMSSKKAKNVLALIIITIIAVLIFLKTMNVTISLLSTFFVSIIMYYINLISIFPLVLIIIVCIAVTVLAIVRRQNTVGG